jgi:tripartite ATP-independent transporter DctM subunit
MTGGGATAVPALGVIAVPSMFKRGYDKSLVMGSLMAGSALGVLIPPSIIMIIYTLFVEESIGALFMGGVFPGLMLSALFILYIGIRCGINPKLGPSVPPEETKSFKEKVVLLKGVILPILLVIAILGSIFTGIATPTEASAVGAFGAIICTAINRRLSWNVIKESSYRTFSMLAMVIWIIFGASAFAMVYQALGAKELIAGLITGLDVNRWVILIIMQITFLILGCVLNNMAILMITAPIYLPIVQELEFNTLWFGILYVINMEMGLLTPPFGMTLFYMKAVVPEDVSMLDIYKSITPFVLLQAFGLVIVMVFPQIALWLPGLMIRPGG